MAGLNDLITATENGFNCNAQIDKWVRWYSCILQAFYSLTLGWRQAPPKGMSVRLVERGQASRHRCGERFGVCGGLDEQRTNILNVQRGTRFPVQQSLKYRVFAQHQVFSLLHT